jgi:RecA-family ATPase
MIKLTTLKEWISMEHNSKPSIVEQILPSEPGEYMVISGRTGIGKSILVANMAFSIATGTDFLGFKCIQSPVGMLAMEGGVQNINDRLTKMISIYPDTDGYLSFELREPFDLLRKQDYFIETFAGCKVVILDNLRQVTTGKYLENNYAAEWIKLYQKLLVEVGAVGILTHHIKKPSGGRDALVDVGDVYQLKGATEYVDAATTVLLLERAKQKNIGGYGKGFQKVDNDLLHVYFAKHRIETIELPEYILVRRNFDKACFEIEMED